MQLPIHPRRLGFLPGLLEEIELAQCFLLGLHGDSFVIASRAHRDMAQPVFQGQADTGGQKVAGRGAAPPVNRNARKVRRASYCASRVCLLICAEVRV